MGHMKTTRRTFIGGAIAFAPLSGVWGAEEKPLLKVGLMTDTHVGKTKASCARARLAYELFRDIGVDLIVNDGDVADHHYPTGYVAYREMVEETFAGVPAAKRPKELFVYAWHDAFDYKNHPRGDAQKDAPEAFAEMQELIKSPNGPYAEGEIKGFPYVVIPQFYGRHGQVDWKRFDSMLSAAEQSHPGKPVFAFAHVPPEGTTRGKRGSAEKRRVLNRHPMAVNISGHSHGSLRDERAIWQGEFTSVNIGCLQNWGGGLPGSAPKRMENYGAVLMEVFANRIVFRRFDVRDRKEYAADTPWIVPWPFDPSTAPYRRGPRAAAAKAPEFAADAKVGVSTDQPFKTATITFPCVSGAVRPLAYRIEIEKHDGGTWIPFARKDVYGDFWQREEDRPATVSQTVSAAYFTAGAHYRVSVRPRNVWGREGRELSCTFTAGNPSAGGTTVWESSDPMKDCKYLKGVASNAALEAKDGFYEMPSGAQARLAFPKGVWEGAKGAKFRFTVDMTTEQGDGPCWTFVLRNRTPLNNAVARISTPPGKSGSMRYVLEFAKAEAAYTYDLLVREGGAGRIRFDYVKIERLS